jgi:hypothetical protein
LIEGVVVWEATLLESDDAATAARGATTTSSPGAVTVPTRRPRCSANEADERHDSAGAATAVRGATSTSSPTGATATARRRRGDGAATDGSARRDDDELAGCRVYCYCFW